MANKLKEVREAQGISVSELARISDVSRMTIWKLENGTPQSPTVRTLQKIADALRVPIHELFDI